MYIDIYVYTHTHKILQRQVHKRRPTIHCIAFHCHDTITQYIHVYKYTCMTYTALHVHYHDTVTQYPTHSLCLSLQILI